MTAMMTFFLVMWLINTASKEQITKLASYFNPVKLSDRNPAKGVHDNESGELEPKTETAKAEKKAEKHSKKSEAEKKPDAEKKPETEKHQSEEEQLFSNPFGVLTQLASQAEGAIAVVMAQGQAGNTMSGGASRDPFITDPVISQSPGRTAPQPTQSATPKPDASAAAHPAEAKADRASEDKHANSRTAPEPGEQQPTDKASGDRNSAHERAGPPHGRPA